MNRRLLLAAAAGLALAAWGVERLVVTDREAIERVLEDAAADVSKRDWDAFAAAVDDGYAERGRDKQAFVGWVRGLYESRHPAGVGVDVADTTVDGDRAATRVVVKPGAPYAGIRVNGRVEFVRTPAGWRISGVATDDLGFLGR